MDRTIENLELSVRASNGLRNIGIKTIGQLLQLSEKDLLSGRNFGRKSLNEIKEVLCDLGFRLYNSPSDDDLKEPAMNEPGKVNRLMICTAKRGYIVTDGANPRVLESPHLIRAFETKDSLVAWLNENLAEEATVPQPIAPPVTLP